MNAIEAIETGNLEPITEVDPWFWAYFNKMKLGSGDFGLKGNEFQPGWMQSGPSEKSHAKQHK